MPGACRRGFNSTVSSTKDRLAEEATRQFAQKGYHGTSIGHLAGALGLHKSAVYTHIDGKEHLLAQIALAGSRSFHDGLDALPSAASPAEKLRLALRTHLRTVASQIGVAVIWLHEWRHLTGEAREEFLTHRRIYEHRIRRLFEEAVRAWGPSSGPGCQARDPHLSVRRQLGLHMAAARGPNRFDS